MRSGDSQQNEGDRHALPRARSALNSWQNMVITLAWVGISFWFAAAKGYSPVEVFSAKADAAFVAVVQRRVRARAAGA